VGTGAALRAAPAFFRLPLRSALARYSPYRGRRPHFRGATPSRFGARLPRLAQPRIVQPMRMLVGILLLLGQLRPVLGAGVCLQASARADQRCTSPMKDMPQQDGRSSQGPANACPLMAVCVPGGPVVPQAVVGLFDDQFQTLLPHSNPVASLPADPIAPPKPPPIV
jgi:hypothetical protein